MIVFIKLFIIILLSYHSNLLEKEKRKCNWTHFANSI